MIVIREIKMITLDEMNTRVIMTFENSKTNEIKYSTTEVHIPISIKMMRYILWKTENELKGTWRRW